MASIEVSELYLEDIEKLMKEDKKLGGKLWELIIDILENIKTPFSGIGKPEALKNDLSGCYSRRITDKHRLIYKFSENKLMLISCYGHYTDK